MQLENRIGKLTNPKFFLLKTLICLGSLGLIPFYFEVLLGRGFLEESWNKHLELGGLN
jgi:hypothetical protein